MGELGKCRIKSLRLDTIRCLRFIVDMPISEAFNATALMDEYRGKKDRDFELIIRTVKRKRSLDQNAYLWLLMERMAIILRSTAEEVYEQMLDRYGLHIYVHAPAGSEETIRNTVRQARIVSTVERNGKESAVYKAVIGSSHYDTEQMTRLLDGVIDECHLLGVRTELDDDMTLEGWRL